MSDQPPHGVTRRECGSCLGWTDYYPDGEISQVHYEGCPEWLDCECGEDDCDECGEYSDEHSDELPDSAFAVALRLMVGACDSDDDAVRIALDDIPDCFACERQVWFSVLRILEMHSSEQLADHLREDLLELLDHMSADD